MKQLLICTDGHIFEPSILDWFMFDIPKCNYNNCAKELIYFE